MIASCKLKKRKGDYYNFYYAYVVGLRCTEDWLHNIIAIVIVGIGIQIVKAFVAMMVILIVLK